jgi:hypothetical protein
VEEGVKGRTHVLYKRATSPPALLPPLFEPAMKRRASKAALDVSLGVRDVRPSKRHLQNMACGDNDESTSPDSNTRLSIFVLWRLVTLLDRPILDTTDDDSDAESVTSNTSKCRKDEARKYKVLASKYREARDDGKNAVDDLMNLVDQLDATIEKHEMTIKKHETTIKKQQQDVLSLEVGHTDVRRLWDKFDKNLSPLTGDEKIDAALKRADRAEKQVEITKAEIDIQQKKLESFGILTKNLQRTNDQLKAQLSGGNGPTAQALYVYPMLHAKGPVELHHAKTEQSQRTVCSSHKRPFHKDSFSRSQGGLSAGVP